MSCRCEVIGSLRKGRQLMTLILSTFEEECGTHLPRQPACLFSCAAESHSIQQHGIDGGNMEKKGAPMTMMF